MKQNIFKSESGNNRFSSANAINTINERRNDRRNNFFTEDRQKEREKERIKKENEKNMALNEFNFPVLGNKESLQKVEDNTVNFLEIMKKEKTDTLSIIEKIPPGWVRINKGANNDAIFEYGESKPETNFVKIDHSLQEQTNNVIEIMKSRWEKYRENYIELYGEDAYEKNYISNINSSNEDDFGCEDDY